MRKLILLSLVSLLLFSCSKEKRLSNRLIKKGLWQAEEITIGNAKQNQLPQWEFYECDIHQDTCSARWILSTEQSNIFYWQFNDRAKTFTISRQFDNDTSQFAIDFVKWQSYKLSGTYDVRKSKSNEMEFVSNSTIGYPNQRVFIRIVKM